MLDHYHRECGGFSLIIHGAALGADSLAGEWAEIRSVEQIAFPANWSLFGSSAGPKRNTKMLVEGRPDVVIAFPGGKGTANMVRQAHAAKVPVIEVPA